MNPTPGAIHVWPAAPREEKGCRVFEAGIDCGEGYKHRLWYAVPLDSPIMPSPDARAFAIGALFLAMSKGNDLVVHGRVPCSLLRNLEELSLVWYRWKPDRYRPVAIIADDETELERAERNGYLAAFSGGLDSHFTLYRHVKGLCGRWQRPTSAALMVHGFDIPLVRERDWASAYQTARRSCEDLGIDLLCVRTNWRDMERDMGVVWVDAFGSALASCLALFADRFRGAIVAADEPYDFLLPWGSTPLIVPMFSSLDYEFVNDGAGYSRVQKAAVVSDWTVGMNNLRVCWEGPHGDRNCCVCEKCVRTILNFRVAAGLLPPCFERDVTPEQIRHVRIRNSAQYALFADILNSAESSGRGGEPWVRALRRRLRRYRADEWKARVRSALKSSARALIAR